MKHARGAFRKFRDAAERAAHRTGALPGGFFLTDPARIADPVAIVEALPPKIGVIVRHFGQTPEIERAGHIVALCQSQRRPVLIAADPDLARETGADGVHWPFRLREQLRHYESQFELMTLSVHSPTELREAQRYPADALILSTVFSSGSPSAGTPIGLMRLAAATRASAVPLYGLGGIQSGNVERVAAHAGFASVSGFLDLAKDA